MEMCLLLFCLYSVLHKLSLNHVSGLPAAHRKTDGVIPGTSQSAGGPPCPWRWVSFCPFPPLPRLKTEFPQRSRRLWDGVGDSRSRWWGRQQLGRSQAPSCDPLRHPRPSPTSGAGALSSLQVGLPGALLGPCCSLPCSWLSVGTALFSEPFWRLSWAIPLLEDIRRGRKALPALPGWELCPATMQAAWQAPFPVPSSPALSPCL